MENFILKKYSRKSVLKDMPHGYLNNQLVSAILDIAPFSLVKIYYEFEKHSFTDDILEELGIVGEFVIKKPSVNKLVFAKYRANWFSNLSEKEQMGKRSHYKANKKRESTLNIFRNSSDNKTKFKNINQGNGVYKSKI